MRISDWSSDVCSSDLRTAWERMVCHLRFSTMPRCSLVVDLALDEAELDDGEADDDDHEDDGLRGRAAEILADEAVGVDLVDEDLGRFAGAALGHGVDDAEGVEEGVDEVDDDEEEGGRREQREDDGPEAPCRPRAVDRRRLDERSWDRLQAGEEEQEVRSEEHTSE